FAHPGCTGLEEGASPDADKARLRARCSSASHPAAPEPLSAAARRRKSRSRITSRKMNKGSISTFLFSSEIASDDIAHDISGMPQTHSREIYDVHKHCSVSESTGSFNSNRLHACRSGSRRTDALYRGAGCVR